MKQLFGVVTGYQSPGASFSSKWSYSRINPAFAPGRAGAPQSRFDAVLEAAVKGRLPERGELPLISDNV
jgi:hypothetical protein